MQGVGFGNIFQGGVPVLKKTGTFAIFSDIQTVQLQRISLLIYRTHLFNGICSHSLGPNNIMLVPHFIFSMATLLYLYIHIHDIPIPLFTHTVALAAPARAARPENTFLAPALRATIRGPPKDKKPLDSRPLVKVFILFLSFVP